METSVQPTDEFFTIKTKKKRKLKSDLTITSKNYYQKIMQQNTYVKVENWALHLI